MSITFERENGNVTLILDPVKREIRCIARPAKEFSFASIDIFKNFYCKYIGTIHLDKYGEGKFTYDKEWDWLFNREDTLDIWKNVCLTIIPRNQG